MTPTPEQMKEMADKLRNDPRPEAQKLVRDYDELYGAPESDVAMRGWQVYDTLAELQDSIARAKKADS